MSCKDSQVVTKREVFYMDTQLFRHQRTVDAALEALAETFVVPRDYLGVYAAPRGLAFGRLQVSTEGNILDYARVSLILKIAEENTEILNGPRLVLIVEKEAVFNALLQAHSTMQAKLPPLLIITGKGYPCLATLRFVNWLQGCLADAKFYVLVDYDPYGFDIALQYRLGSKLQADRPRTCCPRLEFLGIRRIQLEKYPPRMSLDGSRHEMNARDRKTLQRVAHKSKEAGWADLHHACQELSAAGFCTEIEAIYEHDSSRLAEYIATELSPPNQPL